MPRRPRTTFERVPRKVTLLESVAQITVMGYFMLFLVVISVPIAGMLWQAAALVIRWTVEWLQSLPAESQRMSEDAGKVTTIPSIYWWVAIFYLVFFVAAVIAAQADKVSYIERELEKKPTSSKRKRLLSANDALRESETLNRRRAELLGLKQGESTRSSSLSHRKDTIKKGRR